MSAKKKTSGKKRVRSKPAKLSDFPVEVQKKARAKVATSSKWKLIDAVEDTLPPVPKEKKKILIRHSVRSHSYSLEEFETRLKAMVLKLRGLKVEKLRIKLRYDEIRISGTRLETEFEFARRCEEVEQKRAFILAARERRSQQRKEELVQKQKDNHLIQERRFKKVLNTFSKKDIERLIAEAKKEKESKKRVKN